MTDSVGLPDTELVADVTAKDRLSSNDGENEDGTGDTGDVLQVQLADIFFLIFHVTIDSVQGALENRWIFPIDKPMIGVKESNFLS